MSTKKQPRATLPKMPPAVQERVENYVEVFQNLLGSYESDHPDWRTEALLWLIKYGLRRLNYYVELESEREISWDSPFVQLQYPIDWNWNDWRGGKTTGISMRTGLLTDANTKTRKIAARTLAEVMVKHLSLVALQDLTNNVGFERRRGRYVPILGSNISQILSSIRGKRMRERAMRKLFQPFSMGAAWVDVNPDEFEPDVRLPSAAVKKFVDATGAIDLRPLTWTGKINEHPILIRLIFQIHPFVVDSDRRTAHFPLTIGLSVQPKGTGDASDLSRLAQEPWCNPKTWKVSERKSLWKQLLSELDRLSKELSKPAPHEIKEAVVSVTAKIKLASRADGPGVTESAVQRMLKAFAKSGEVIQWDCETAPQITEAVELPWSKLSDHDFERLLFNLVADTRGYENPQWLTHTNAPDKGCDVSVTRLTRDPLSGTRLLRVILQCKHKKNIGVAEVSHLKDQMLLWEPPRVDELVIATSGCFSGEAVAWIERHNQSNHALRILMWPRAHLERLLAARPHLSSRFFH